MKYYIVATYKINEINRLERNLSNQNFEYYLPKIKKKINANAKLEALFPGYIFVNIDLENHSALKYTKGIKNILKLGDTISCISNEEIEGMKMAEERSKINPVVSQIKIGQDVTIAKGSLAGIIAKVCSLPSKERVDILLSFLGSMRRVSISEKDLII
jgi:transcription antitermination factor NusG